MSKNQDTTAQEATLPAKVTQKDVPTMLQMVTEQIKTLKGGLPSEPHTTSELPGFGKIVKMNKVDELIKAASSVIEREKAYKHASTIVMPKGMKVPTFKINGSTKEQWIEDITARVAVVANKTQLEKLYKAKKTLEENLSAEAKLERDLANLKGMLTEDIE